VRERNSENNEWERNNNNAKGNKKKMDHNMHRQLMVEM
jgi:hypothetical protein